MVGENLSIKEINIKLKEIEADLYYYIDKKNKAFMKTQPKSTQMKQDLVDGGTREDKNAKYVIIVEELEPIISDLNEEMFRLRELLERKLKILGEYEPLERKIIQLREEEKRKWNDIAILTNYSERQCRRIYDKFNRNKQFNNHVQQMSVSIC